MLKHTLSALVASVAITAAAQTTLPDSIHFNERVLGLEKNLHRSMSAMTEAGTLIRVGGKEQAGGTLVVVASAIVGGLLATANSTDQNNGALIGACGVAAAIGIGLQIGGGFKIAKGGAYLQHIGLPDGY